MREHNRRSPTPITHTIPGYYGTVGSGQLGSFSDHFLAAGFRPEVQTAVPESAQISTDPVAGMIDLGSNLSSPKDNHSSSLTNQCEINELKHQKQYRSAESINTCMTKARLSGMIPNLFSSHRPRSANC
ncbi:unnamed protein product [Adineta ricciae]|uniref:Uncharacterized protein n=1 Tax=Adineta ricciae TaxID=249248 RepID=A0A816FE98_ADIRI|nr:unnamed protein product [Adineta ricciae]CAF1660433.1 unnamed protein product [Adineta ricciae]